MQVVPSDYGPALTVCVRERTTSRSGEETRGVCESRIGADCAFLHSNGRGFRSRIGSECVASQRPIARWRCEDIGEDPISSFEASNKRAVLTLSIIESDSDNGNLELKDSLGMRVRNGGVGGLRGRIEFNGAGICSIPGGWFHQPPSNYTFPSTRLACRETRNNIVAGVRFMGGENSCRFWKRLLAQGWVM